MFSISAVGDKVAHGTMVLSPRINLLTPCKAEGLHFLYSINGPDISPGNA